MVQAGVEKRKIKINILKTHTSRGFAISVAITLFVLGLFVMGALDALELKTIDFRFKWRGNRPVDERVAIIAIDEASQEKLGRWPWPRKVHGDLVRLLDKAGAQVIVFDTLVPEPDLQNPGSDAALVAAAKDTGKIVQAFHFKGDIQNQIQGVEPLLPYAALMEEVYIGFANHEPDSDGVSRREYLYAIDGETVYPSLGVATFALSQKKTIEEIFQELPIVLSQDPVLAENALFINYAFDLNSVTGYAYPVFSYNDVLTGKIKPAQFKDKIVLIGATAAGLGDVKPIPFISKHPGVMIHANIVDNLLNKTYLGESPTHYTALYVLLLGLAIGLILPRFSTWNKLLIFLVVVGGGVYAAHWLFSRHNFVIHMVPPLLTGVGCYGGLLFYQVVVEEREKRKIKGSFKQYLSPKIIDILTKDPSKLKLGGEEREVSIFFLDIAGFTTMSEALKPTQLVEVMNECLTVFSEIILKHDGLINKYIGDCIMAFWNAPADQPKHASLACRAALECIAALPNINKRFQEKGLPSIDCRVGINTGLAVVGNMGSHEKFDYTVLGDAVNLASRMEGANKIYHSHIMVSDTTFEQAREDVEARDLDLIRVKGKKEPRKVFEILCKKGEMSHQLENGRRLYHNGLHSYRVKQFDQAIKEFKQVFDYLPGDHLTRVYLDRAETFLQTPPPPEWDGVFEMKTK